jgi:hypothetical protein
VGDIMAIYNYSLSENGWEYEGLISVESDEKPVCINTEEEHYLIVNGAKIFFDEEIREDNT